MGERSRVLVVADDDILRATIVRFLTKEKYDVVEADRASIALAKMMPDRRFDLILADIRLPGGMDGIDFLREVRHKLARPAKLILMTGQTDPESAVRAIRLGIDDMLYKPFEIGALSEVVERAMKSLAMYKEVHRAEQLSQIDALTNLFNYRHFHSQLDQEIALFHRKAVGLGLVLIDIDHLKLVNTTFGHSEGDMILRRLAEALTATTRASDTLFRYGGDEFAVLLRSASQEDAQRCAERMRKAAEATQICGHDKVVRTATVSAGFGSCPATGRDKDELIAEASRALAEAKQKGRNQVCGKAPSQS